MANNKIEVHVSAKTSELKSGMNDAERIVDNSTKKIETSTKNMKFTFDFSGVKSQFDNFANDIQRKARNVGENLSKSLTSSLSLVRGGFFLGIGEEIARGVAEGISALPELVTKVGETAKQIENQARLANATTTEFQEWAFASKSVSVEQDKLSDIMKDVNDKFGDFMQTGGGEMKDFFEKIAPKVGVTAKEFQGLSGPQILGKYYDTLKKANVSQAEMTFYMEAIANDATLLAPLLDKNGEKLKEYAKQAHDLGVIMDQDAIAKTKEFNTSLGTIQATMQGVFTRMAAQAAPFLTELANDFLDFAVRSRDGIDGSVTAIITIFESLVEIAQDIFSTIGDIWSDLTSDIGDGSIEQIGFMDLVSGALKGFGAVATGLQVGIKIAFELIRSTIVTVSQAIAVAINVLLNTFGGFRDTIQYGLDVLSIKFQTFGSTVKSILSFDFSGASANWDSGLAKIGTITDQYTTKMKNRANDVKKVWNDAGLKVEGSWKTAWDNISGASEKGGKKLQYLFLKPDEPKTKTPPPLPTFNPNHGIGTGKKDEKEKKPKKGKSDAEREAEREAKALADIRYKYATKEQKIALDLAKALDEIEKSKVTSTEKIAFRVQAEKDASEKIKQLRTEEFEETKQKLEALIESQEKQAQRSFEISKAQIQADYDAGKISNVEKVKLEKDLYDQLLNERRKYLEKKLALEDQQTTISGKEGKQGQIKSQIADVNADQTISDTQSLNLMSEAQMKDFEKKFGGLTDRISSLWDKGIQSMMNGTLTWKNATNAVMTDMAGFFIQKMVTEPLRQYMVGLARRLAVRLGFIKTETAVEVAGQTAQTGAVVAGETTKTMATSTGALARLAIKAGEAIKSIMMYAWEAMAGAFKAMVSIPYIGPVLAVAAGASALALVGGLARKIKSARGGYDIPAGVNPVTQLHEEEMVLPKQHANTIRALGKSMANGGDMDGAAMAGTGGDSYHFSLGFVDTKGADRWLKKNGKAVANSLKGYNRNFGK